MSDPVTLASTCPLPNLYEGCDYPKTAPKKSRHIPQQELNNVDVTAVAPYQAMPVAGPIITHNKSTALAVFSEEDDLLPEVVETAGGQVPQTVLNMRGAGEGVSYSGNPPEVHHQAGGTYNSSHGVGHP